MCAAGERTALGGGYAQMMAKKAPGAGVVCV